MERAWKSQSGRALEWGDREMNARRHRQLKQAKETAQTWTKRYAVWHGCFAVTRARTTRLPVYRARLNHPVNHAEHGNAADPGRPRDRADLAARRVRGRSTGMTEEANAFRAFKPAASDHGRGRARRDARATTLLIALADWKTGDTADWEVCASSLCLTLLRLPG